MDEKARPTLPEVLSFRGQTKTFNVAQQIGTKGSDLGVLLLEDDSGAIVDGIAAGHRTIEDTNLEILKKWLQGSGVKPVTWSTLTDIMRKVELFDLAAEIDEAKNVHETKVPPVIPLHQEYVDGQIVEVPEGVSALCTAKAEYTQYPHGSRQDCWTIVSIKASRIVKEQSVDIVAVIDTSGSMAGSKIELVKETLLRLINQLDENDRIALLTYDTSVKQYFGLQQATAKNKKDFQKAISSIKAHGRTNLCDGLMKGLEILAYNGGPKPAPIHSVLLLGDGQPTEGVTTCEKIIKEMNKFKSSSGSVYTFAFGTDCDFEMMETIAKHGNGVCYFIDSLEKIASSFGNCLGGLKTVVAQNLSVHIEMQGENRINEVRCHDAVQWLKEDEICDISLGDIQCGEEKCVVLTLILSRLTEEKNSDIVLKGTFSYLDTGLSTNRSQDFLLDLKRADGCSLEKSNYLVDQQRNRILAIECISNLKKSGKCRTARSHMSELISTINESVSRDSPWTKKLISELERYVALLPDPSQGKEKRKNHTTNQARTFPEFPINSYMPARVHTSLTKDEQLGQVQSTPMPEEEQKMSTLEHKGSKSSSLSVSPTPNQAALIEPLSDCQGISVSQEAQSAEHDQPETQCKRSLFRRLFGRKKSKSMKTKEQSWSRLECLSVSREASFKPPSDEPYISKSWRLFGRKKSKRVKTKEQIWSRLGSRELCCRGFSSAPLAYLGDELSQEASASKDKNDEVPWEASASKDKDDEVPWEASASQDKDDEVPWEASASQDKDDEVPWEASASQDKDDEVPWEASASQDKDDEVPWEASASQDKAIELCTSGSKEPDDSEEQDDSEEPDDSDDFSSTFVLNSMLHGLTAQRSNHAGGHIYQTEAKEKMEHKIQE